MRLVNTGFVIVIGSLVSINDLRVFCTFNRQFSTFRSHIHTQPAIWIIIIIIIIIINIIIITVVAVTGLYQRVS
jgi:hypothetical protein